LSSYAVEWYGTLLDCFYNHGHGLLVSDLDHVNAVCLRKALVPLTMRETNPGQYGRNTNHAYKATTQSMLRDEYLNLDAAGRVRWLRDAAAEELRLPKAHQPYEVHKAQKAERDRLAKEGTITMTPTQLQTAIHRAAALQNAMAPKPVAPPASAGPKFAVPPPDLSPPPYGEGEARCREFIPWIMTEVARNRPRADTADRLAVYPEGARKRHPARARPARKGRSGRVRAG